MIKDYTNFNSQVYAPMTRIGMYLDSGSEQYSVKSRYTNTLEGTTAFTVQLVIELLSQVKSFVELSIACLNVCYQKWYM